MGLPLPDSHIVQMSAYGEAFPDVILHKSYHLIKAHVALFSFKVFIMIRQSHIYLLVCSFSPPTRMEYLREQNLSVLPTSSTTPKP